MTFTTGDLGPQGKKQPEQGGGVHDDDRCGECYGMNAKLYRCCKRHGHDGEHIDENGKSWGATLPEYDERVHGRRH